jgi:hypothetical protein
MMDAEYERWSMIDESMDRIMATYNATQNAWEAFERDWPHWLALPVTKSQLPPNATMTDRMNAIRRRPSMETDPVTLEALDWVNAQGLPYRVHMGVIGFREADHAFWFKMRCH